MQCERAAKPANPLANLNEDADLLFSVPAGAAEHANVELLKLRFDLVECLEVTRHDPPEQH